MLETLPIKIISQCLGDSLRFPVMFVQHIAKPLTFTVSPQSRNWFLATEPMEEGEEVYFLTCFLHKSTAEFSYCRAQGNLIELL